MIFKQHITQEDRDALTQHVDEPDTIGWEFNLVVWLADAKDVKTLFDTDPYLLKLTSVAYGRIVSNGDKCFVHGHLRQIPRESFARLIFDSITKDRHLAGKDWVFKFWNRPQSAYHELYCAAEKNQYTLYHKWIQSPAMKCSDLLTTEWFMYITSCFTKKIEELFVVPIEVDDIHNIKNEQEVTISSGTTVHDVKVRSGGFLTIMNGGSVTKLEVEPGATCVISDGGYASLCQLSGVVRINGTVLNTMVGGNYASAKIGQNGVADDIRVYNSAELLVMDGGVAKHMSVLSSGHVDIYSDGIISDGFVNPTGFLYLHSGAIVEQLHLCTSGNMSVQGIVNIRGLSTSDYRVLR